jgi:hypothetical protein
VGWHPIAHGVAFRSQGEVRLEVFPDDAVQGRVLGSPTPVGLGRGGRGAGSEREPTSGPSSCWNGSGWPPAARRVERNGVERLDIKEGRGVGRENGK